MGFPTTRSSMFISNGLPWTVYADKNKTHAPSFAHDRRIALSRPTITLVGLFDQESFGVRARGVDHRREPQQTSVFVHRSPPRRSRGDMRFFQLAGARFAAHLNRLTADPYLDGIRIQLAVASRTGFLNHDIALRYPKSGYA